MRSKQVALATLLLGGARLVTRFLDFIGALVVARFVTPEDFGVVLIAVTALTLGRAVTDMPINQALVRKDSLDRADLDTAFTLSLIRGALVATVLACLAYPFADIYSAQALTPMMLVLAAAPVAAGAASPALVRFTRELDYRPASVAEIGGKLVGFSATISMALATASAWSIIVGLVLSPAATTAIGYLFAPYRPGLSLRRAIDILRFAGWMNLANSVATVNVEGGRFFIAAILGNAAMGLYSIGHSIAQTAIWSLSGPIVETLFAGLAQVKDDVRKLLGGYLNAQSVMVASLLPVGIFLSVASEPLIRLLFNEEWAEASAVVAWLAPAMAVQMIAAPVQSLAMALGHSKAVFDRNLLVLLVSVPLVVAGAYAQGIAGAAAGRLVGNLVWVAVGLNMANGYLATTYRAQLTNIWRSLASSAALGATVIWLGRAFGERTDAGPLATAFELASLGAAGAAAYVLTHLGLWVLSGRPTGCERVLIRLVRSRAPALP